MLVVPTKKPWQNIFADVERQREFVLKAFQDDKLQERLGHKFGHCTNPEVNFLNYGNTQAVFSVVFPEELKVEDDRGKQKVKDLVASVNQRHIPAEIVRQEFENLSRLYRLDDCFVPETVGYYEEGKRGFHLMTMRHHANCVYSGRGFPWGIFTPHLGNKFTAFEPKVRDEVLETMIALLVNYYDEERGCGIANTQISGDDFLLKKGFDPKNPNTVKQNIKLVAARDLVHEGLDEYVDRLRSEFVMKTHYTNRAVRKGKVRVNTKCYVPLSPEIIERGIEGGMIYRSTRKMFH